MKVKVKKQKPFRMTVFITSKQLDKDGKPAWPSVVHIEQMGPDSYRLILESTDWRWLVRVVDHMSTSAAGIDKTNPPILEYLGPYSTLNYSRTLK